MSTSLRLLVVEDDDDSRQVMARLLVRAGFTTVAVAASGDDALAVLAREPIDMMISDIAMPGMNGCELMALVRSRHPRVIGVAVTAYTDPKQEALCRAAGFAQFITKPASFDDLLTAIAASVAPGVRSDA